MLMLLFRAAWPIACIPHPPEQLFHYYYHNPVNYLATFPVCAQEMRIYCTALFKCHVGKFFPDCSDTIKEKS